MIIGKEQKQKNLKNWLLQVPDYGLRVIGRGNYYVGDSVTLDHQVVLRSRVCKLQDYK